MNSFVGHNRANGEEPSRFQRRWLIYGGRPSCALEEEAPTAVETKKAMRGEKYGSGGRAPYREVLGAVHEEAGADNGVEGPAGEHRHYGTRAQAKAGTSEGEEEKDLVFTEIESRFGV